MRRAHFTQFKRTFRPIYEPSEARMAECRRQENPEFVELRLHLNKRPVRVEDQCVESDIDPGAGVQ